GALERGSSAQRKKGVCAAPGVSVLGAGAGRRGRRRGGVSGGPDTGPGSSCIPRSPPPLTKAPSPRRSAHWPRVPASRAPPPAEHPRLPSVPASPPATVPTDLTKMPSQMEHAMETMMFTFHKFAGDKGYLTKEDLRVLMEKEFPGFLENQKDPLAVDKIMKDLDQCRDGKVGFQSFFSLIAGLTIACNDYFVVHMKQKGKK
uniref:Protein S100-A10 n=1 Tax=Phocoena sinus TaxID=42100 RepID=A0A8C9B5K8_PHOSS